MRSFRLLISKSLALSFAAPSQAQPLTKANRRRRRCISALDSKSHSWLSWSQDGEPRLPEPSLQEARRHLQTSFWSLPPATPGPSLCFSQRFSAKTPRQYRDALPDASCVPALVSFLRRVPFPIILVLQFPEESPSSPPFQ